MQHPIDLKNQIINTITSYWENTPADERYFSLENIQNCDTHLTNYIINLYILDKNIDNQAYIKEEITKIYNLLSTFDDPEEADYLEFQFGFMYSEFVGEIASLIRMVALENGFKDFEKVSFQTNYYYLKSDDFSPFRIVLGKDEEHILVLEYHKQKKCFYFDETPYYDPSLLPIFELQLDDTATQLSFEVLTNGELIQFVLEAQNEADTIWLQCIYDLHYQKKNFGEKRIDFDEIELIINRGMLYNFNQLRFDDKGEIITMYDENCGAKVFTLPTDLEKDQKADEYLVFVHAYPEWKSFVLADVVLENKVFSLTSTDVQKSYNAAQEIIETTIVPKTFHYPLKSHPILLDFIENVMKTRKPFVTK